MIRLKGRTSKMERKTIEDDARILISQVICSENRVSKLLNNIYEYDQTTFKHSINVAYIATQAGIVHNMKNDELHELAKGALLHDVGKILVPEKIIKKKSKLTDEEYEEAKNHPEYGSFLICDKKFSSVVKDIVIHHHEREDGSGYPHGLRKSSIPLPTKIVSVCDAYDAMTSERQYKPAYPGSYSLSSIENMEGYSTYIVRLVGSVVGR